MTAFFAHVPSFKYWTAGRRFLHPSGEKDLTGGRIAHLGFTMAVHLGDREGWTMNLNVNCTYDGLLLTLCISNKLTQQCPLERKSKPVIAIQMQANNWRKEPLMLHLRKIQLFFFLLEPSREIVMGSEGGFMGLDYGR
jgi:hypothetical protein